MRVRLVNLDNVGMSKPVGPVHWGQCRDARKITGPAWDSNALISAYVKLANLTNNATKEFVSPFSEIFDHINF